MDQADEIEALVKEARSYAFRDPSIAFYKARQAAELIADIVGSEAGIFRSAFPDQDRFLNALEEAGLLSRKQASSFHKVRIAANRVVHRQKAATSLDASAMIDLLDGLGALWRTKPASCVPTPSSTGPQPSAFHSTSGQSPRPFPIPVKDSQPRKELDYSLFVFAGAALLFSYGGYQFLKSTELWKIATSPPSCGLSVAYCKKSMKNPDEAVSSGMESAADIVESDPQVSSVKDKKSEDVPTGKDGLYGSLEMADESERTDRFPRQRDSTKPAPKGRDGLYGSTELAQETEQPDSPPTKTRQSEQPSDPFVLEGQ